MARWCFESGLIVAKSPTVHHHSNPQQNFLSCSGASVSVQFLDPFQEYMYPVGNQQASPGNKVVLSLDVNKSSL